MKLLVTGVKGQLGHDIVNECKKRNIEAIGVDVEEMDITDEESVNRCTKGSSIVPCSLPMLHSFLGGKCTSTIGNHGNVYTDEGDTLCHIVQKQPLVNLGLSAKTPPLTCTQCLWKPIEQSQV